MKNILLPTDFSENSWNAISYAIQFFEDIKCNFYLIHVVRLNSIVPHESPYPIDHKSIEDLYIKPAKQQTNKLLKRI
jgi:hypothetical protein